MPGGEQVLDSPGMWVLMGDGTGLWGTLELYCHSLCRKVTERGGGAAVGRG